MMLGLQNELRDDARLARVFKGSISGVLSKASTLVVTALSLPIAVRYLGPQQYGLWVTISTTVVMFAVMDLGIAFTLTNHIATAYARDDRRAAQRYYATAFWASTAIAVPVAVAAIFLWPVVSWGRLLQISDDFLAHEVSRCAAVALAFFLVSLPLNLVHRVLGGYQQTEITNYFNVFRNLLSLAAILVVASLHGSLFLLMLIYSLSLMAGTVGLNLWMNLWNRRWMFPSPRHIDRAAIGDLFASGSGFFMLQIAGLIVFNTDNIVIAHYLGAAAVAPYSITWRVAAYALVMQSSVSPSLWPAYSEAYAKGDLGWLRKTFWRMARISGLTTLIGLILFAIFGHMFLEWYVGTSATPTYVLLWAICGWTMISAGMDLEACLLAAVGCVRGQSVLSLIAAALNILISVYLVKKIGSTGAVAGTAISYVLVLIVPQTLIVRRVLYPRDFPNERLYRSKRLIGETVLHPCRKLLEILLLHGFRWSVALGRALTFLPRPSDNAQEKRLLVIYLTPHLGDSVMLMPMLERLRAAHPNTSLELVVEAKIARMFESVTWLDRIHGLDIPLQKPAVRGYALLRTWQVARAYQQITHVSANICILPRWGDDLFRSHYLAYLVGSERRIGWTMNGSRYCDGLLTETYSGGSGMREAERFSLLAASAGLTSSAGIHKISGSTIRSMHHVAEATEWACLADRIGIDRREAFAVISPGASTAVKRWPVERWLDVITWLRQQDLQIVLLSGPDDADVARQLHTMDGMRAVLSDGTTTLAESVTLTSHALVFVGNDSGPGHVAGSLGVPTLVIFSSTERCHPDMPGSPERNLPAGPNVTYCQPARSLWPCDRYCTSRKAHCIEEVAVGQVLSQLGYLWESTISKSNSGYADDDMPAEKIVS